MSTLHSLIDILRLVGSDGYEKLLFDALNADQSHFVHSDEVTESWSIVDDLLCTGEKCPVRTAPFIYHWWMGSTT